MPHAAWDLANECSRAAIPVPYVRTWDAVYKKQDEQAWCDAVEMIHHKRNKTGFVALYDAMKL